MQMNDIRRMLDGLTPDELRKVGECAFQFAREHEAAIFNVGDMVEFDHKRMVYTGNVTRINSKTISVDVLSPVPCRARIAPQLLRLVARG